MTKQDKPIQYKSYKWVSDNTTLDNIWQTKAIQDNAIQAQTRQDQTIQYNTRTLNARNTM